MGPIVRYEQIPDEEICYALLIDDEKWVIPKTNARYINHSCSPNCIIDDDLNVRTTLYVNKGEELSICYNIVHPWENPGPWNPKWSFKCECGSKNCQKVIDQYVYVENEALMQKFTANKEIYDVSHI